MRAVGVPSLAAGWAELPWLTPEGGYAGEMDLRRFRLWARNGFKYGLDTFVYGTAPVTLAPAAALQVPVQVQADSAFECIGINVSGVASSFPTIMTGNLNVTAQLQDGGPQRNLFSAPAPLNLIGGVGTLTHILPVPKIFPSIASILWQLVNIDTAITFTQLQISMIGRKIFTDGDGNPTGAARDRFRTWQGRDGRTYWEDYYAYVVSLATLASGATAQLNFTIETDSDFEWIQTSQGSLRNATTGFPAQANLLTLQIQDGGSQRNLMSLAAPVLAIGGSGQLPYINPIPRIFKKRTPVNLTLTNLDTVAIDQIYLVFEGRKIKTGGGA
jgi:hypothetical protein